MCSAECGGGEGSPEHVAADGLVLNRENEEQVKMRKKGFLRPGVAAESFGIG